MIVRPDLSSEASIAAEFEGATVGSLVPGTIGFIQEGVRIGASYIGNPQGTQPNEKLVGWWLPLEPRYYPYYGGPRRMSMRYRFKVEPDYAVNAAYKQGKWPGLTSTYGLWSESVMPPSPAPSSFATWEARMFDTYDAATDEWPLGIYYYGVRNPDNGTPTSIGKYDGQGTQGGVPMTTARLKPGVWYDIEEQVVMNSVKDTTLFIPATDVTQAALDACLANANEDGVLRILVDGVLVYESRHVAFRGLECVGIQTAFVNVYDGGHSQYPKGPMTVEFGSLVVTDDFDDGGGAVPADRPTQAEKDAVLAQLDHASADISSARAAVVTWPVGTAPPPLAQTIDSFTATPPNLPAGGGTTNLAWTTSNATAVALDGQPVAPDGNATQVQTATSTYVLTATGVAPTISRSLTVDVLVQPAGSVLDGIVAGMAPDSWALVQPHPANMDLALLDPIALAGGNENGILPYGAATNSGYILGGDHAGRPKFVHYDEAGNSFVVLQDNTAGSHAYQNTWYPFKVLTGRPEPECGLYKWDGAVWNKLAPLPENATQYIPVALCLWNGKPVWYTGNSGILYIFDEATVKWSKFSQHPNQVGIQNNVSAPTPIGIVFGGGHSSGSVVWTNGRELYLSDGVTRTRMQDAPYGVGIESMQMTGNGKGKVMLVGFGEAYELDPASGVITRRANPPTGMLQPNPQPGKAKNLMSWAANGYSAWVQYDRTASPKTAMYLYKPV